MFSGFIAVSYTHLDVYKRQTFNFVAIVGTLGLIGMIIKNGIVLMDEITLQINQGVEPVTALIDLSLIHIYPLPIIVPKVRLRLKLE